MKRADFIEIASTGKIHDKIVSSELDALVSKYPYCSGFRVAQAMAKKRDDALDTKNYINKAAVYIQDRSKLYDYIIKADLEARVLSISEESIEDKEEIISTDMVQAESIQETEEKPKVHIISSQPLEEEIMAAALQSLGEFETERYLDSTKDSNSDIAESIDFVEETDEGPLSFGSWLLKKEGKATKNESKGLNRELIDKFIQEDPKISPVRTAFFSPSQMGKMSLLEDESFVTETLAKIYENQGDFHRAARAYKNLGLKNPEKRSYFAALQKKVEDQIKK